TAAIASPPLKMGVFQSSDCSLTRLTGSGVNSRSPEASAPKVGLSGNSNPTRAPSASEPAVPPKPEALPVAVCQRSTVSWHAFSSRQCQHGSNFSEPLLLRNATPCCSLVTGASSSPSSASDQAPVRSPANAVAPSATSGMLPNCTVAPSPADQCHGFAEGRARVAALGDAEGASGVGSAGTGSGSRAESSLFSAGSGAGTSAGPWPYVSALLGSMAMLIESAIARTN